MKNIEEVYKNYSIEAYWEIYKDLDRIYTRFAKACGLSDGEYWTLVMIKEGCTTQKEIWEQLSVNKQTIHSAIKQLIKKGLIQLEEKKDNRREKQILFTKEGEDFAKIYIDDMVRLEKKAWDAIEEEEQKQLLNISRKYNDLLESELDKYLESE